MVHLTDAFPLPASAERVWQVLQEVPLVVACIPGASADEKLDDDTYRGGIGVQYRDIGVRFDGNIRLTREPTQHIAIVADGSAGRQVSVTARIDLRLIGTGDTTRIELAVDFDFTGPFAAFASSATRAVGPRLFRAFGACLTTKVASAR